MSRGSEKEGGIISLARRREYSDLCSLPTPLYASSPGNINPQSLCTIKSPKLCSKSLKHTISVNPERHNIVLKFNNILKGSISMTSRDSHKDNKNSRSMSSKDKSLQASSKTLIENKSPN